MQEVSPVVFMELINMAVTTMTIVMIVTESLSRNRKRIHSPRSLRVH
jgi:hypothetical protein